MPKELSADAGRTIRDALHDARSRLGAIRLAVTSLTDAGDDAAFAASLVDTADRESLRLGAELTAVSALVRALTDPEPAGTVDLAPLLGLDGPLLVAAPPETIAAAVDALLRLCGERDEVTVDVGGDDEQVRIRFDGPHASTAASTIGPALIAAIGTPDADAALGVALPRAR